MKSADPGSVFAELIRAGLQALIDAEATEVLGAGRYERTEQRTNYRNGTRPKTVATTSGDVEVQIPKLVTLRGPVPTDELAQPPPHFELVPYASPRGARC